MKELSLWVSKQGSIPLLIHFNELVEGSLHLDEHILFSSIIVLFVSCIECGIWMVLLSKSQIRFFNALDIDRLFGFFQRYLKGLQAFDDFHLHSHWHPAKG